MSGQAFADQERKLRQYLDGETCIRAFRGYGSALVLDFLPRPSPAPDDPDADQQSDGGLVVETCAWRLEDEATVIVGSADPYQAIDARVEICVGKRVEEIRVYRPSFMAHLRFAGGLALWIFPDAATSYADADEGRGTPWYVAGWSVR